MHTPATLGLAILLAAGCGGSAPQVASPVPHACEVGTTTARPPVRRLVASVTALDEAPRTDDHVALLGAMRALGDSLAQIAPDRTAELARVRTMTHALERAVGNADAHADFVRIGLVSAWSALRASAPRGAGTSCFATGLDEMIAAASRIAPDQRLAAQYPQVRAALHAATAAVLAAGPGPTIATRGAR